jgi:hypothetical protein
MDELLKVKIFQPHGSKTYGVFSLIKGTYMPNITIDNKDYDFDTLSDDAKAQFVSIQFVDQELLRLQNQAAAYQTARIAYSKALQAALPVTPVGDTIKLN